MLILQFLAPSLTYICLPLDHCPQLPGSPGVSDRMYPKCGIRPHMSQNVPRGGKGDKGKGGCQPQPQQTVQHAEYPP